MTISDWVTAGTGVLAFFKFGWDGYVYFRGEKTRPLEIARKQEEMRALVQHENEEARFVWSATLQELENKTALEVQQMRIDELEEELRRAREASREPDKWHKPRHKEG